MMVDSIKAHRQFSLTISLHILFLLFKTDHMAQAQKNKTKARHILDEIWYKVWEIQIGK